MDLSSLLLACQQCSEGLPNVPQTAANHCQEISGDETKPQEKSNLNACISEPESIELASASLSQQSIDLGSQGTVISQLQNKLQKLGYYKGVIDGKFSENTQAALAKFLQEEKNLGIGDVVDTEAEKAPQPNPPKTNTVQEVKQIKTESASATKPKDNSDRQIKNPNKNNYVNYLEAPAIEVPILWQASGILFMLTGGLLFVWKRIPKSQRHWQLLFQGNSGVFSSGITLPAQASDFDQPVILKQSRAWSHAIVWCIVGVSSFAVVWACTAKIDESVPVQGKLQPKGSVKEIQAPVGGVISKIHVQDGQKVKKGELLVSFDPTAAQSKLRSLQEVRGSLSRENMFYRSQMRGARENSGSKDLQISPELASLTKNRATLMRENQLYRAELKGGEELRKLDPQLRERLINRQAERDSRIEATQLDVEQLTKQFNQVVVQQDTAKRLLATNLEIVNNLESLVKNGAFARLSYLERRQTADTSQAEVNRLAQEQQRLQLAIAQGEKKLQNAIALSKEELLSRISENEQRIAEIDSQLSKVVVDNEKQIQEIDSQISEILLTLRYQELRAPSDGVIFDLKPRGSGYVYNTSETILKVVPPENLVAEVFITNNDIGFVRPGMTVDVRIDSFPYTEFSDIKGELISIGSDALPPDQLNPQYRFPAQIRLDKQSINVNGRQVPLQSGMSLNANVNIRKRTVMSIFTEQFFGKIESLKYTR